MDLWSTTRPDDAGITFRRLVEDDLGLLHWWLNEPGVVRWWVGGTERR